VFIYAEFISREIASEYLVENLILLLEELYKTAMRMTSKGLKKNG
jgi:hypothetical protein